MRDYRSRLSEIEERKSIKSAIIFGCLTLLILILIPVVGFPIFTKLLGSGRGNSPQITTDKTTVLPPTLAVLPQFTNQKTLIVKGTGTPNSTIKITFNNSSDETTTDGSGNFAANIGLTNGTNTIYAQTIDSSGNVSNSSTTYAVNYTDQVPNLTINVPQNNQTFYGSGQQNLTIQGVTDTGNTVTINDHIAILDNSGKFSYPFNLQNGDNNLKIISTDQAGNKKEIDLKVTFNP